MLRSASALLLTLLASSPAWAGDSLKLAVVDVQKVMEGVPAWQKAIGTLKKEWEKKQATLESTQAELRKKKEALDAKKTVSDPKTLAAEEGKLMESAKTFTEDAMRSQQQIAQREGKLKEAMLGRIERLVYELAERDEYTYVFESGQPNAPNVLFASKGINITPQVVALYKERFQDQPIEADIKAGDSDKDKLELNVPPGFGPGPGAPQKDMKPQFRQGSDGASKPK